MNHQETKPLRQPHLRAVLFSSRIQESEKIVIRKIVNKKQAIQILNQTQLLFASRSFYHQQL